MLVGIANELDPGKFGVGVKHPRPTLPSRLFLFASWYVPWSGAGRDRIDAVCAARMTAAGSSGDLMLSDRVRDNTTRVESTAETVVARAVCNRNARGAPFESDITVRSDM